MREEVLEPLLADEELEPAVESLWWVSASQREPGSPAWLKTSGLNRLGLPELEFLEVPVPLVPTTAHLLDELAARIAEDGPPPPGTRMAVGPELELRAVPPREVLSVLPEDMPGQAADREPDAAPSIVFTGPDKIGATRPTWPPATNVLQRLADEPCVVYRATRSTKRRAHLARQTWDDLGMVHAKMARLDVKALVAVKAAFGPESAREHCWLRLDTLEGNTASGVLDADARMVPGLQQGDTHKVNRDEISDWCVVLNEARFDPESVPALWRAVDALTAVSARQRPPTPGFALESTRRFHTNLDPVKDIDAGTLPYATSAVSTAMVSIINQGNRLQVPSGGAFPCVIATPK